MKINLASDSCKNCTQSIDFRGYKSYGKKYLETREKQPGITGLISEANFLKCEHYFSCLLYW